MKKILTCSVIVFAGLVGLLLLAGLALYSSGKEKLSRSYPNIPVETIKIPNDADTVAQGKHIAVIWACTRCHGENMGGTLITTDPIDGYIPLLGTIPAANLTSGKGGIGESYTDADWIRAIRYGVTPDSRVEIFMYDYSTMSDRDLGDLIAYLKQVPPVDSDYPALSYGPVLPIASAIGFFTPAAERIDHNAPRQAGPVPAVTKEYGGYLWALCSECHGTGLVHQVEKLNQGDFVRALRTGAMPNGRKIGAAMPIKTYTEMNDTELGALWLYSQDLPPTQVHK